MSLDARSGFSGDPQERNLSPDHGATFHLSDSKRDVDTPDFTSRVFHNTCCDFACIEGSILAYNLEASPVYSDLSWRDSPREEIRRTIECVLDTLDDSLRALSLQIHSHPELMFEEMFDLSLIPSHGFCVTRHYLGLQTAFKAEFIHGKGGRTLGINSEMDALPVIGHACGHNLIAVSGVGVALAIKSVLETFNVPGKVVLLGTPAEESGGGKIILLDRGAYEGMDACLMCHPSTGPELSSSLISSLALQSMNAEFFGQSAHAGYTPWEGINALDAAVLAYSSVSALRQQINPDHRVHGIILGSEGRTSVIPHYAKMKWMVRAPTRDQLARLTERVCACLKGAALATSCRLKITESKPYYELRQNCILACAFSHIMNEISGVNVQHSPSGASTDFGNVSYVLPSLHPAFAIPTKPNGGNHSPAFADSARTIEAHKACMITTKALACLGFRVLEDEVFFQRVREGFEIM